jgi:hypothetical protein
MTNSSRKFSRLRAPIILALGAFALAGCAQPALYQPRVSGASTGYTDQQLTQNRFRITYAGNTSTPRPTVENYLLLRAAEVTRAAGFSDFVFDTRNTQAQTSFQTIPNGTFQDPYFGYGRRGRFGGFRGGYWGGLAYEPSVDIVSRTKYEAYAEIVLLTPAQAARTARAVNAQDVMAHVGPEAAAPPT